MGERMLRARRKPRVARKVRALVESHTQRQQEQIRTSELADDISPGFRREDFSRLLRERNPELAIGLLSALQTHQGLPPLSAMPMDAGV